MPDVKPFLSLEAQIEKICSRGCTINDKNQAMAVLSRINYYRFSAYFLPFKQADGSYKIGTAFAKVYGMYEFDRRIRGVVFQAVARIEVLMRSRIAYLYAENYGPLGYLDAQNYSSKWHNHAKFLEQIKNEIRQNRKVLFVKHHIKKYDNQFPLWVIVELFTFGMLSKFYADLQTPIKKKIARSVGAYTPEKLSSWLRCCTELRNICAHHGRLYFRRLSSAPAGFTDISAKDQHTLFTMLRVIKNLYPERKSWNTEVVERIDALITDYQDCIQLRHIGFPADWKKQLEQI
ncbi:MAG: Abi family protein [Spirochaetaceae bacterium]|jgi:abortive infection bacteriophage resistance protein|nr:Abi family protein [Spirochaetaceae bacterium]